MVSLLVTAIQRGEELALMKYNTSEVLVKDYSGDPNKHAVPNKRAERKNIVKLINVQA